MTPQTAEEVTLEWINECVLDGNPSATEFDLTPIGDDVGFLGDLCRLSLSYDSPTDSTLPDSLIIKFPTSFDTGRESGRNMQAYQREVAFYANSANTLPWCNPPRHHYSAPTGRDDEYLLVIEDLLGHRFVPQVEGINHDDARNVVSALARLHAHYWESEALKAMEWLHPLSYLGETLPPAIESGWPLFEKHFAQYQDEDLWPLYPLGNALYTPMINALQQKPSTLLHGDPRMENVAFTDQGGPESVRIYDWQLCCHGPAAYDLMYFFIMSINVEDWDVIGEELINLHHKELVAGGVTDYPQEELREDLALSSCLMIGWGSQAGNILPNDESGHAFIKATAPRAAKVMKSLGAVEALTEFSERYQQR
jgi:hypothetical protein